MIVVCAPLAVHAYNRRTPSDGCRAALVCISGALGGVGRGLVEGDARRLRLHAALGRGAPRGRAATWGRRSAARRSASSITDDIEVALATRPDALIDYTHPTVIRRHLDVAFARGVPVVIGTTGLADADFEQIDAAARAAGVGARPATSRSPPRCSSTSRDSPRCTCRTGRWSSTTRRRSPTSRAAPRASWPSCSGRVREPHVELPDDELIGPIEARGAEFGGARVHSLRLPGYGSAVEVHFGLPGERLVMRHDGDTDGRIFVRGSLLAAQRIQATPGLVRGLDTLLFA